MTQINRSRSLVRAVACVLPLASALAAPALASPIYNTVALTGTDGVLGPGEGTGISFFSLGGQQPSINDSGQVGIRGQDSTTGNPNGTWLQSAGANSVVAIDGGAQPGGGTYAAGITFNNIVINNSGDMAWRFNASSGLFGLNSATPGRLMLAGDFAPGTTTSGPLAKFSGTASGMPLFNSASQSAFIGSLTVDATLNPPVTFTSGVNNSAGIWVGTPGNTQLVLRQNDAVTAIDPGGNVRVGNLSNLTMSFNDQSKYAIVAALQGNVVTGNGSLSNSSMIASNRTGSFAVVAQVGNAAPDATGAPSATNIYRTFGAGAIAMNDAGHLAYVATLRNGSGTQTSAGALFSDVGSGTMRLIANAGDTLPTVYSLKGTPLSGFGTVTWGSVFTNVAINANDDMLIQDNLANTGATNNTAAIFELDSAGLLHKVEQAGDVAIPGGAPNGSDAFFLSTTNEQINAEGDIAFMATLTGTGISGGAGNNAELCATDASGDLIDIARTSALFEVAPGDYRTISAIGGLATSGGQDGHIINLNASGELAFELNFSDGSSGIFTAYVPEPTSLLTGAIGLLALARRSRPSRA